MHPEPKKQQIRSLACCAKHTLVKIYAAKSSTIMHPESKNQQIRSLACCAKHTLVKIYATESSKIMHPEPKNQQIRSLACGAGHTLALDHRGRVWATGMSNASGFYQNRSDFGLLPPEHFVGKDVVAVRAGGWNSAAKTADGALFTWGLGRYGAPGHGDTDDVTLPCPVDFLEDVAHQVVEFAVGWSFCVVATNVGLFTWGNNSAGQLGLGDMVSRTRPNRVLYWDASRRTAQVVCCTPGPRFKVSKTDFGL